MWLRANVVLAVAVVFAVVQMFASVTGGPRIDLGPIHIGVPLNVTTERSERAHCLETAAQMHATPAQALQLCPA